jgi:hypothetical protein
MVVELTFGRPELALEEMVGVFYVRYTVITLSPKNR